VEYLFNTGLTLLLSLPFGELAKRLKLLSIVGYVTTR
jgi:hypothetical protein